MEGWLPMNDGNGKSEQGTTFEDAFTRLEEVVRQLEGGQPSLDRAIELYEEGMKLSKLCDKMLQDAQLRITKLQSRVDNVEQSVEALERGTGRSQPKPNGGVRSNMSSPSSSTNGGMHEDEARGLPW